LLVVAIEVRYHGSPALVHEIAGRLRAIGFSVEHEINIQQGTDEVALMLDVVLHVERPSVTGRRRMAHATALRRVNGVIQTFRNDHPHEIVQIVEPVED
jgi:hypothetical protein